MSALLALAAAAFALSSPGFQPGGTIPRTYTCEGENHHPPLVWRDPPRGTRSFALSMVDPDAPGGTFTHWLAWGIPAHERGLAPSVRPPREGRTSFGRVGYGGPCPPGGQTHRYFFRLYALRSPLPLRAGADRRSFDAALRGRVLRVATLVGRYAR